MNFVARLKAAGVNQIHQDDLDSVLEALAAESIDADLIAWVYAQEVVLLSDIAAHFKISADKARRILRKYPGLVEAATDYGAGSGSHERNRSGSGGSKGQFKVSYWQSAFGPGQSEEFEAAYEQKFGASVKHTYSVLASDYLKPSQLPKKAVSWAEKYRESDFKEALSVLDEPTAKFVGYEDLLPWEFTWSGKPAYPKDTFGWGKSVSAEKLDRAFYDKYERYPEALYQQAAPVIIINGKIGDGMGRAAAAHAVGQKVRSAVFTTTG